MAAVVTQESDSSSVFDEFTQEVASWFGDGGDAPVYPKLSEVPTTPAYEQKAAEMKAATKELEADRAAAQKQQQQITDWPQLVDEPQRATPVTKIESKLAPAEPPAAPKVPDYLRTPTLAIDTDLLPANRYAARR